MVIVATKLPAVENIGQIPVRTKYWKTTNFTLLEKMLSAKTTLQVGRTPFFRNLFSPMHQVQERIDKTQSETGLKIKLKKRKRRNLSQCSNLYLLLMDILYLRVQPHRASVAAAAAAEMGNAWKSTPHPFPMSKSIPMGSNLTLQLMLWVF